MIYAGINIDNLAEDAAKFVLENDRLLYRPFFIAAEEFCAANGIIIGGQIGIDLLARRPLTKDSFMYDLYSVSPFSHARQLTETLSRVESVHVPAETASLQTWVKHREFTISINARMFFRILAIEKYRGESLEKLLAGPAVPGYFVPNDLTCVSAEVQLIEIYRTLSTPARVSQWSQALKNEAALITFGASKNDGKHDFTQGKRINWLIVLEKLFSNPSPTNIIIGDHALASLGIVTDSSRLQFISSDDVGDLHRAISRLVDVFQPRARVTYVKYHVGIPTDFRIIKYTFYAMIGRDNKQLAIADVYNSSQYDLIPFIIAAGHPIGHPWVLLRFLFIDLWLMKMIGAGRESNILQNCRGIREYIRAMPAEDVFPLENYAGVNTDDNVAKKKIIKDSGDRFPTYYPARS